MKYSLLIFVACILLDLRSVKGVLNGTQAALGEFPYMVGIMLDGTINCGGALISDKHVLTNANCVIDREKGDKTTYTNLEVLVGAVNTRNTCTGEIIEVDKVKPHPNYLQTVGNMAAFDDIAVVTLKHPITKSKSVKPIALPEPVLDYYPAGTEVSFCGFGVYNNKGSFPKYLMKMSPRIVSHAKCQVDWDYRKINPGHLCADSGICLGDIGGPLTVDGKVLIGISSEVFNNVCGTKKPDIYTRVSHYLDFIRREMGQPEYIQTTLSQMGVCYVCRRTEMPC